MSRHGRNSTVEGSSARTVSLTSPLSFLQNSKREGLEVYCIKVGDSLGAAPRLTHSAAVRQERFANAGSSNSAPTEKIVDLALPDKKYASNQSSLYKVRRNHLAPCPIPPRRVPGPLTSPPPPPAHAHILLVLFPGASSVGQRRSAIGVSASTPSWFIAFQMLPCICRKMDSQTRVAPSTGTSTPSAEAWPK